MAELSNKGVLRVAAGKNFSMALTESGDVWSWGAGGALQLGHGSKVNEELPRLVEALREVRKLGGGSAAPMSSRLAGAATAETSAAAAAAAGAAVGRSIGLGCASVHLVG